MCDLCKTFGRRQLQGKDLKKAMAAVTPKHLNSQDHMTELVDLWMGFNPGQESESNSDAAEAWEKGHRGSSNG